MSVPTNLSSFYFDSPLSAKRQRRILEWLATLEVDQYNMVSELIEDAKLRESFENGGEET